MLKDLIEKLPNTDACLELIETFDKLLRKYARLLRFEDAYEELRLFFIELILQLQIAVPNGRWCGSQRPLCGPAAGAEIIV